MSTSRPCQPERRRCLLLGGLAALFTSAPVAAQPVLHGFTENLPPLNHGEPGRADGFSVRLLELMAQQAGLELRVEVMPWPRAVQTAQATPNSLLFSLTRTAEREDRFLWIGPISERRILVYQLAQRPPIRIKQPADLKAYRIGVVRESATARQLQAEGFVPDRDLEYARDDAANVRKLLAQRMDLIVILDWAAAWHLAELKLPYTTLREVAPYDVDKSYWYGLRLDSDPALQTRLQAALRQIKADGRYDRLRAQYFR